MTVAELNFLELVPMHLNSISKSLEVIAKGGEGKDFNLPLTKEEFDALYNAVCLTNRLIEEGELTDCPDEDIKALMGIEERMYKNL